MNPATRLSPLIVILFRLMLASSGLLVLASCGGGGTESPAGVIPPSTQPPTTQPPTTQPPTTQPPATPPPVTSNPQPYSPLVSSGSLLWSDPDSWPVNPPMSGDAILIPAGTTIVLDGDTPTLSSLTIEGTLEFAAQDVSITSEWIMVRSTGVLRAGSPGAPYTNQAVITLTGDPSSSNQLTLMGSDTTTRGLIVMGGRVELFGAAPTSTWTRINGHISAGDNSFFVDDATGWEAGDQIILTPSDFYGLQETEQFSISSVSGNQITVSPAVAYDRWGTVQYASDGGMTQSPGSTVSGAMSAVPTSLDERAEVGNISRNIIIQSPNDNLWQSSGFGAHMMAMSLNSVINLDGVEFKRVGQAGILARYPFHWHVLSYDLSNGNLLGDAVTSNHFVRNSSIHESANRCVTIHGTNGVEFSNNICFGILGHAIFFEDGVERRNVVQNNLIAKVRNPLPQAALKLHDIEYDHGSSGIWLSNPDNTLNNNHIADAQGHGIWMAFSKRAVGLNASVPIQPFRVAMGNLNNNTMHSNAKLGVMFDNPEQTDGFAPGQETGAIFPLEYWSTNDGVNPEYFTVSGWSVWKNNEGGIWNRDNKAIFESMVVADGSGKYVAGGGLDGQIRLSLIVGRSLNSANESPAIAYKGPPTGLATYHSEFQMYENVIVNFPHQPNMTSGAFATDDFYVRPVEKGIIKNRDNILVNTHPGYRTRASVLEPGDMNGDGIYDEFITGNWGRGTDTYVLAGALWDPYGYWGPSGNWSVYDQPFYTWGATVASISPASTSGAVSVDGDFYGVYPFVLNKEWESRGDAFYAPRDALNVIRYEDGDASLQYVDSWFINDPGTFLQGMRHFAARQGGLYLVEFPGQGSFPTDVLFAVSNMFTGSEEFVMGIKFDGSNIVNGVYGTPYLHLAQGNPASVEDISNKHLFTAAASLSDLVSGSVERYWQDTGNDIVWMKVSPNGLDNYSWAPVNSNANLYNEIIYRVW